MSWLYVPGLTDSLYMPETEVLKPPYTSYCPDIEPFVLSNGKPTPRPPSWHGWKKRGWARVLCGMTLPPSTLSPGVDSWISSLRVFHVNRTAEPERVFENVTRVTDGLMSSGLCARLCRQSFGEKTSQLSLPGVNIPSSPTWKAWVTELQRESTARRKSARRIFANGSLFSERWPTPRASDGPKGGPNQRGGKGDLMLPSAVQDWATPTASVATGGQTSRGGDRKGELLLAGQAMWATPTTAQNGPDYARSARKGSGSDDLVTQAAKWGTPTARDWKGSGMSAQLPTDVINGRGPQDAEQNNTSGKSLGLLNPEWVEQLMGWVPGMSNFSASETEWSRWLALWRSFLFGKS